MQHLIRNVVIPSAAGIALLVTAVTGRVQAEDNAAAEPVVVAAAAAPMAVDRNADAAARPGAEAARVPPRQTGRVEGRCERTDRIGKFHITRCD